MKEEERLTWGQARELEDLDPRQGRWADHGDCLAAKLNARVGLVLTGGSERLLVVTGGPNDRCDGAETRRGGVRPGARPDYNKPLMDRPRLLAYRIANGAILSEKPKYGERSDPRRGSPWNRGSGSGGGPTRTGTGTMCYSARSGVPHTSGEKGT